MNNGTDSSETGKQMSLMQLYFLIVLVLAITNLILGVIYGCIQHKDTIHSQICFTEYRRAGDESNALRVKRPISANLVLNAGTTKTQLRPMPSVATGARATK